MPEAPCFGTDAPASHTLAETRHAFLAKFTQFTVCVVTISPKRNTWVALPLQIRQADLKVFDRINILVADFLQHYTTFTSKYYQISTLHADAVASSLKTSASSSLMLVTKSNKALHLSWCLISFGGSMIETHVM